MTAEGVAALRADREEVCRIAHTLQPSEWEAASDCAGWRVQDVVAHLANTCRAVADPSALPPGVDGDLEASQDVQVDAHRHWTSEAVLADYEAISAAAIEVVARLLGPPPVTALVPIEDAGVYPLHLVANALAFDHFCHLRNDILAPNGPIHRSPPPSDALRVRAALEWMMAGLPQMSPQLSTVVVQPVQLDLTGPGGEQWTIAAHDGTVTVETGKAAETVVRCAATDFIVWATHRRPWRDCRVTTAGNSDYASTVLDAIRVF